MAITEAQWGWETRRYKLNEWYEGLVLVTVIAREPGVIVRYCDKCQERVNSDDYDAKRYHFAGECVARTVDHWDNEPAASEVEPSLVLLVIDLNGSCVVKVEKGHINSQQNLDLDLMGAGSVRVIPGSFSEVRSAIDAIDGAEPTSKPPVALIDCPYGIGEDGSTNSSRGLLATSKDYKPFSGNDLEPPSVEYFEQLFRVTKNQIIFGANHFITRIGKDSPCWFVWDKDNGATDFADCELAWTSFTTAVRRFRYRWQGMLQENMKNKEERIHPTQKPIAVYLYLLRQYAKIGQSIIDTHLGSGSSRIAAYDLGFDFTSYELDKDYFNAQEQRFANHIAQPKLFAPTPIIETQDALFA